MDLKATILKLRQTNQHKHEEQHPLQITNKYLFSLYGIGSPDPSVYLSEEAQEKLCSVGDFNLQSLENVDKLIDKITLKEYPDYYSQMINYLNVLKYYLTIVDSIPSCFRGYNFTDIVNHTPTSGKKRKIESTPTPTTESVVTLPKMKKRKIQSSPTNVQVAPTTTDVAPTNVQVVPTTTDVVPTHFSYISSLVENELKNVSSTYPQNHSSPTSHKEDIERALYGLNKMILEKKIISTSHTINVIFTLCVAFYPLYKKNQIPTSLNHHHLYQLFHDAEQRIIDYFQPTEKKPIRSYKIGKVTKSSPDMTNCVNLVSNYSYWDKKDKKVGKKKFFYKDSEGLFHLAFLPFALFKLLDHLVLQCEYLNKLIF